MAFAKHEHVPDMHGNCFRCGMGPKSETHFMFELSSEKPYEVRFDNATQTFVPVSEGDYEIITGLSYPKEPLPDRILHWFFDVGDWFAEKIGDFFATYVGKWVGVVLLIGFLLFMISVIFTFVVLVVGAILYGPDVCANYVWPEIVKYNDGGCS